MSKRTALKIVAFLCGLYFILDFLLPVKLGGDFDGYAVSSPAPVVMAQGATPTVYYVGQYSGNEAAIGRLLPAQGSAAKWQLTPEKPVLQRSLFVSYDQSGMDQLQAIPLGQKIELLYIGQNKEFFATLCRAQSDDQGINWKKVPPVLFYVEDPDKPTPKDQTLKPTPTLERPNGLLPGDLKYFAAHHEGNTWRMVLILETRGKGNQLWTAAGDGLSNMRLSDQPLLRKDKIPAQLSAFDARRLDGAWQIYFAEDAAITSILCKDDGTTSAAPSPAPAPIAASAASAESQPVAAVATSAPAVAAVASSQSAASQPVAPASRLPAGTITAFRVTPDGSTIYASVSHKLDTAPSPEESIRATELAVASYAEATPAVVFKQTGAKAKPTYVSRGIEWAGTFLQILGSFAVFIAMINLVMYHSKRVMRWQKRSYNSLIFFSFLVSMFLFTIVGRPDSAEGTIWRQGYNILFDAIAQPMGTAVFSMITFFMISAAYRSFRVRSTEAALLMIAACIVMIGQMPVGQWLSMQVPASMEVLRPTWVSAKLLNVINSCAYRGVLIGLTIGQLSIALRIWVGMDNSVYSGLEGKN